MTTVRKRKENFVRCGPYMLCCPACSAALIILATRSKVAPNIFMFYRGAVPALLLLPFLPFAEFVPDRYFYVVCVLQGFIISFIDYRNFRAMRTWGAETVSSIHPFNIGFVFVVWLVIRPSGLLIYWEHPLRLLGIVIALSGVVYSVSSFRKSRRSAMALRYMFPYILASAVCDALNKLCMSYVPETHLVYGSYFYILITAVVVAVVNFVLYRKDGGKTERLYRWNNLKYTPVMLFLVLLMAFKNYAMFNTPNPSFVTAIMYAYVIWIMVFAYLLQKAGVSCRHRGLPRRKVLLLLASIVLLILLEN